jgi:hypothetical protein
MSRSFDLIKLLVEFGYEIGINGHCVLQYVSQISLRRCNVCSKDLT